MMSLVCMVKLKNMNNALIHFSNNGLMQVIECRIKTLKKEGDMEVLYTNEGHRIPLENLISMNGVSWA
jgi:hypothetical protein